MVVPWCRRFDESKKLCVTEENSGADEVKEEQSILLGGLNLMRFNEIRDAGVRQRPFSFSKRQNYNHTADPVSFAFAALLCLKRPRRLDASGSVLPPDDRILSLFGQPAPRYKPTDPAAERQSTPGVEREPSEGETHEGGPGGTWGDLTRCFVALPRSNPPNPKARLFHTDHVDQNVKKDHGPVSGH